MTNTYAHILNSTTDCCDLCDDDGCDWTDGMYVYHKSCVTHRIANPNSSREERGLRNTLSLGQPWPIA